MLSLCWLFFNLPSGLTLCDLGQGWEETVPSENLLVRECNWNHLHGKDIQYVPTLH